MSADVGRRRGILVEWRGRPRRRQGYARPDDWLDYVDRPQSDKELAALRRCVGRGAPFGREAWVRRVGAAWGMESTLRPRGRPRRHEK